MGTLTTVFSFVFCFVSETQIEEDISDSKCIRDAVEVIGEPYPSNAGPDDVAFT